MPVIIDFQLGKFENGVLVVEMHPPTPIGGWGIQFDLCHRMGGTAVVTKSCASGYGNGVSGITVISSGDGRLQVSLLPSEVSGLNAGNYYYRVFRTDSGVASDVTTGYRLMGL